MGGQVSMCERRKPSELVLQTDCATLSSTSGTEIRISGGEIVSLLKQLVREDLSGMEQISLWHCTASEPDRSAVYLALLIRVCPQLQSFTMQQTQSVTAEGQPKKVIVETIGQACTVLSALADSVDLKYLAFSCQSPADAALGSRLGVVVSRLVRLDLAGLDMSNVESIKAMADSGMRQAVKLRSIQLPHCQITDDGFGYLSGALLGATSLRTLRLSHNHLTARSLPSLGALLEAHKSLTFLNVGHQPLFLLDPVAERCLLDPFLKGVRACRLQEFSLAQTTMESKIAIGVMQSVATSRSLRSLDLSSNPFLHEPCRQTDSFSQIRTALRQNTSLTSFHLHHSSGDNHPQLENREVLGVLQRNASLQSVRYLDMSQAPVTLWSRWLCRMQKSVEPSVIFCVVQQQAQRWREAHHHARR